MCSLYIPTTIVSSNLMRLTATQIYINIANWQICVRTGKPKLNFGLRPRSPQNHPAGTTRLHNLRLAPFLPFTFHKTFASSSLRC